MKNLVKILVSVAVAAIALVSCNKESNYTAPDANAVTIRVHASVNDLKVDDETKTYIDTYKGKANTILWGTGEYMSLCITSTASSVENKWTTSTDASADLFNGEPAALFEFTVSPQTATSYKYQGLYPASAASTTSNTDPTSYKVNLPATQNATADSYDPAAYIMVAQPEDFTSVETDWEVSFRRATALNKITLKNVPTSVSISSVKITAPGKKLAGGRHFNLSTGVGTDVYGTDATIEVKYATALTGTNVDVWFTSWDVEIAESETLTIVVYTTDKKSYTKTITVPSGKTIKFKEGRLNTLIAKMDGITPVDVATVADGTYLVLARKGSAAPYTYYAMKGEANGTRIAYEDYSGDLTSYNGEASLVWTITASGNSYTFENRGNYLGWSTGNAADLIPVADYDADKCLMSINDNGDGTYKVTNTKTSARYLAKNTSSAWFAFYESSGQYGDIVFVPATSIAQVATPTFDPAAGAVAANSSVTISCATSGATIHYTVDNSVPTSSSPTYSDPIVIDAAKTIKAIAVKDGMADSEVASAVYTIAGTINYPTLETSNVSMDGVSNGSGATVNGEEAIKVGTSSAGGSMKVTVPAGTAKLHLHAAAWKGVTGLSLDISGATVSPSSIDLTADDGISSNSPFTLSGDPEDFYFVLELSGITTDTDITFTSSISKRFVVWGVNAEAGAPVTPKVATPTFSLVGYMVSIACATDGATIYYTTDGSAPSTSSSVYDSEVSISGSQQKTIKAFATKSGYDDSEMASKTYYAINIDAITNGTVTAKAYAAEGDEITLTITPDSGYTLGTLNVTDSSNNPVSVSSNKFTMPASPVTVSATFVSGNDGSLEHPYTVSEVRAYMDASESNRGPVYITGIVSSVNAAYDQAHGTGIFFISDDGTTTSDQFEAYSVRFLGNNAWVNGNTQIAVGDAVVVYGGELTIYNTSVYETKSGSGSYLYSLNGITSETVPTISVTDITDVAAAGVSGATTTVSLANNDGWSASVAGDGTIVTSASISGSTITYSVAANTSDARTGSITITLSKTGRTDAIATINVAQLSGNGNTSVTVSFTGTSSGGMTTTAGAQTGTKNNVTIEITNGVVSSNQIRIYKNANITITAPSGKSITEIVFTTTTSSGNYSSEGFPTANGYTRSGNTGTWTGSSSSVTLTASNYQVRATEIKVTYE